MLRDRKLAIKCASKVGIRIRDWGFTFRVERINRTCLKKQSPQIEPITSEPIKSKYRCGINVFAWKSLVPSLQLQKFVISSPFPLFLAPPSPHHPQNREAEKQLATTSAAGNANDWGIYWLILMAVNSCTCWKRNYESESECYEGDDDRWWRLLERLSKVIHPVSHCHFAPATKGPTFHYSGVPYRPSLIYPSFTQSLGISSYFTQHNDHLLFSEDGSTSSSHSLLPAQID